MTWCQSPAVNQDTALPPWGIEIMRIKSRVRKKIRETVGGEGRKAEGGEEKATENKGIK